MAMPASAEATATLPVVFITSRRDGLCLGVSVTMDLLPGGKLGGNERATMLSSFSNLRRKSIAEIEKADDKTHLSLKRKRRRFAYASGSDGFCPLALSRRQPPRRRKTVPLPILRDR